MVYRSAELRVTFSLFCPACGERKSYFYWYGSTSVCELCGNEIKLYIDHRIDYIHGFFEELPCLWEIGVGLSVEAAFINGLCDNDKVSIRYRDKEYFVSIKELRSVQE